MELVSVRSVPMGIAVDTAGRKLYWTASSGKIKRANLDGSGRENVVPGGLDTPMDLALADGNVYWTQGNGSVRFASLTGQIRSRPISTGSDTPWKPRGSVAVKSTGRKRRLRVLARSTVRTLTAQTLWNSLRSGASRWGSPLTLSGANSTGLPRVVKSNKRTSTVRVPRTLLVV